MRPTLRRLESQMQPTSGAAEAVDQTSLAQRPRENLLAGSLPYGHGQGTLARPKSLPGLPQPLRRRTTASTRCSRKQAFMLPEFVIDALAETAKGKGRDDLLWQSAAGAYIGPPASKESWLSGAVARCQKADPTFPRVTAHALRHTAASLAISAGANPKVVQRMLGHASAAMTLDVYADLFDSDLTSVAESVGKMWARLSQAHVRSTRKRALPGDMPGHDLSPLSGLN